MSRQSTIRWRESDRQSINKEVRRFNAKLDRLSRANPEIAEFLPERKSVRAIRGTITTRAELNRELRSIDRLFKPKATELVSNEQGLTVTRYEKKEIGIKVGIINRQRSLERAGANVSTDKGTMGSVKARALDPKPFNFDKIRPGKEWDKYVESVEKQSRSAYKQRKMEQYKENYLKGIKDNLGKKGKDLYDMLKKVDAKTLYKNYYDDQALQIDFIYDPLEVELIAETATAKWKSVLEAENAGG